MISQYYPIIVFKKHCKIHIKDDSRKYKENTNTSCHAETSPISNIRKKKPSAAYDVSISLIYHLLRSCKQRGELAKT